MSSERITPATYIPSSLLKYVGEPRCVSRKSKRACRDGIRWLAFAATLFLIALSGCRQNGADEAAVAALQNLGALVKIGTTYDVYMHGLAEASVATREVTAGENPISDSIRDSMKWFKAAADVWETAPHLGSSFGYCDSVAEVAAHPKVESSFYLSKDVSNLCRSYPELVRESEDYLGKGKSKQKGMYATIAEWDAWKRASFSVRNAEHLTKQEPVETPKATDLQVDERTTISEVAVEAMRSVLNQPALAERQSTLRPHFRF